MGGLGLKLLRICAASFVGSAGIQPQLFGPENASLPFPAWSGGLDILSADPPIFLLRGFISGGEAERLLRDYELELIPEFVRSANDTSAPAFQRCVRRFPASFCESVPAAGDRCDFQTDRRVYASQAMVKVHERVASTVGVAEDHVEEAWLFHWDKNRRGQDLHMDTYHHFQFPPRIATVLVRLRDDPVGVAFPLAKWPAAHALAEDENLVEKLTKEGNELPWRGSGTGRSFKSLGYLDEAFAEVCRKAPLRLRKGDALLYYHLLGDSKVNMRSVHASCATETADAAKIFMAKFVRGGSLLGPYDSLRTPPVPSELRAWMDWRQERSGLDTAAIWIDGADHGLLDPTFCQQQKKPWFVRPAHVPGGLPVLFCGEPREMEYVRRMPGESFEIHVVIANTGTRPWPPGTVLSLRDGHTMGGPVGLRLQEVPVGSTVPLALQLQAPSEPGTKAYSIWSLADGERVPFGALLWVDAAVAENEEDNSAAPGASETLPDYPRGA
ncbi:ANKRD52 [Symbiodinium natans]|uniref:ANKRD52 protein n=1 Tax=Symbiodinium natans TaxID=878477 RepID=A0A812U7W7_9DINO|nr:ANKRD52 [Symbiodinium natans]